MTDPHCSPYLEYCPATPLAFHVAEGAQGVSHRTRNILSGLSSEFLKERPASRMRSSERRFPGLKKVTNKVPTSRFANHKTLLTDPVPDVTVCGVSTRRKQFVGVASAGAPLPSECGRWTKSNRFGC
jgi:hypothetical protein